jgi:hypothetical protein
MGWSGYNIEQEAGNGVATALCLLPTRQRDCYKRLGVPDEEENTVF